MHPRETNPQQNQSASPGQAESLELPTTPATSREWHGRALRKSDAATFSVLVGSYRGDLRKRRDAEVAQLSNGSRRRPDFRYTLLATKLGRTAICRDGPFPD